MKVLNIIFVLQAIFLSLSHANEAQSQPITAIALADPVRELYLTSAVPKDMLKEAERRLVLPTHLRPSVKGAMLIWRPFYSHILASALYGQQIAGRHQNLTEFQAYSASIDSLVTHYTKTRPEQLGALAESVEVREAASPEGVRRLANKFVEQILKIETASQVEKSDVLRAIDYFDMAMMISSAQPEVQPTEPNWVRASTSFIPDFGHLHGVLMLAGALSGLISLVELVKNGASPGVIGAAIAGWSLLLNWPLHAGFVASRNFFAVKKAEAINRYREYAANKQAMRASKLARNEYKKLGAIFESEVNRVMGQNAQKLITVACQRILTDP